MTDNNLYPYKLLLATNYVLLPWNILSKCKVLKKVPHQKEHKICSGIGVGGCGFSVNMTSWDFHGTACAHFFTKKDAEIVAKQWMMIFGKTYPEAAFQIKAQKQQTHTVLKWGGEITKRA